MLATSASLSELAQRGSGELTRLRERDHPPRTAIEWLGIAVGGLPELGARARMVDEIQWRARAREPARYAPLLDELEAALANAAALVHAALLSHLARHPAGAATPDEQVGSYAELLIGAHRRVPRRAELLAGGYTTFLAAAIESGGSLADAERTAAAARRWEHGDHEREISLRAAQLREALVNALGELLAYARLTAEDAARGGPPPPG